jgi:phage FluMu protein gp41
MEMRHIDKIIRDLRAALTSLSDQSLKTSRRLDDTYYSILEKVSVLRQTIGSLQELSGLTKELRENFESDTKELIDDVQGQFDSFDNFGNQQQQLVDLEDRIRAGKKKADYLTDRLASAKERVDARAQAELEWATKNTRTVSLASAAAHVLMLLCRPHAHILGSLGVNSCPSLCTGPLPPAQASSSRAPHETYSRFCIASKNHGCAYPRHSERSDYRTFDE